MENSQYVISSVGARALDYQEKRKYDTKYSMSIPKFPDIKEHVDPGFTKGGTGILLLRPWGWMGIRDG